MKCSKCSGKVKVLDTIHSAENEIYRRRKCLECGRIFFSTEFEVETTADFLDEYHKSYRTTKEGWKKARTRIYTLYRAKDDTIVASGTAKECAEQMGTTVGSFKSIVSRAKNKQRKKWEVYIGTDDDDDVDCWCE
jgi:transcriptional regulator NrdR family protein